MGFVKAILRSIDRINELVTRGCIWFVIALVLTLVFEVVMRYILKSPTLWSYDMSYMLGSLFLILGMGYTFQVKGHVNVDIIVEKLSSRKRALLSVIFMLCVFFPLWLYFLYNLVPHLKMSWAIRERAAVGTWLPPFYPFKTWVFVGVSLLALQGIAEFIRDLLVVLGRGDEA